MLTTDETGWNDFGAYGGGANLGHPTPNVDRVALEGAVFTNWYGQARCTAGRASFMTGRIPIRSALSVVVLPGDENGLTKSFPTIAEFFRKNGYSTYFWGKWHLGDQPKFYPMVGLTPPPHGAALQDNDGKPIYFDSIDNSAYILGKARHSARTSWIYIDGESFAGSRRHRHLGAIGSTYNLTMDPFENRP